MGRHGPTWNRSERMRSQSALVNGWPVTVRFVLVSHSGVSAALSSTRYNSVLCSPGSTSNIRQQPRVATAAPSPGAHQAVPGLLIFCRPTYTALNVSINQSGTQRPSLRVNINYRRTYSLYLVRHNKADHWVTICRKTFDAKSCPRLIAVIAWRFSASSSSPVE